MTYGSVWVFFQLCYKKTIHIVAMHVKSSGECQGWMEVFSSESEKDKLSWNLKHHEVKNVQRKGFTLLRCSFWYLTATNNPLQSNWLGFFQVSSAALVQSQLICLQLGFLKFVVFCCILLLSTYSSNEISLFRIFRLPKLLQLGCSLLRRNHLECYEAFRVTCQKWWRRQSRLWLRLNKR